MLLQFRFYSLDLPARKKMKSAGEGFEKMKSAGEGFATQVNFECNEKKIKYKINLAVFPEYDHKNKSIHLLHKHKIIINI